MDIRPCTSRPNIAGSSDDNSQLDTSVGLIPAENQVKPRLNTVFRPKSMSDTKELRPMKEGSRPNSNTRQKLEEENERSEPSFSSPSISNTIFHRVSNSVSGLLSNVSWSEWLKSPIPSSLKEGEDSFFEKNSPDSDSYSSSSNRSKCFNHLYPEEGITDNEMAPIEPSTPSNTENFTTVKPFLQFNTDQSSFKKRLSLISSTPTPSSSSGRNQTNEDIMNELKPSTSRFQPDILTPREDPSIYMLKNIIPEVGSEHPVPSVQSNGSLSRSSLSRKRLRDNIDDGSSDDADHRQIEKRGRSCTFTSPQMLSVESEETTEPERRKRPRFSVSAFGSPIHDNVSAQEEQSFSIFYPGKIAFGGVANHQRKRTSLIRRKVLPRAPTTAAHAPEDDSSDGGLSSVARRILSCIDKISTPLTASKRALPFTSSRDFSLDTSSFVADFHKHRPTVKASTGDVASPPVGKLLTPSKVKTRRNISSLIEDSNFESVKSPHDASNNCLARDFLPEVVTSTPSFSADINGRGKVTISSESLIPSSSHPIASSGAPMKLPCITSRTTVPTGPKGSGTWKQSMAPSLDIPKEGLGSLTSRKSSGGKAASSVPSDLAPDETNQYKFSEPEVLSSSSLPLSDAYSLPASNVEFHFSQPLDETRVSLVSEVSNSTTTSVSISGFSAGWAENMKPAKGNWECNVCLLLNDCSRSECIACTSAKPQSLSRADDSNSLITGDLKLNSTKGFGDLFKVPEGSWECESCLLHNKADSASCIACLAARPQKQTDKINTADISLPAKTVSENIISWGDAFKPQKGSWDCEMCLLQNRDSVSKCAACETPKPEKKTSKPTSSQDHIESTTEGVKDCWGDSFKPQKGSWECSVCLIQNVETAANCVACSSSKPKDSSKSDLKEGSNGTFPSSFETVLKSKSLERSFGKNSEDNPESCNSTWDCSHCLMTNENFNECCFGCNRRRGDFDRRINHTPTGSGFATKVSNVENEWECETCLARNKLLAEKCGTCEAPKCPLSPSSVVSQTKPGSFKFGVKPVVSTSSSVVLPTFSFSPPSTQFATRTVPSIVITTITQESPVEMKTPSSEQPKFVFSNNKSSATVSTLASTGSLFGNSTESGLPFASLPQFKLPTKDGQTDKIEKSTVAATKETEPKPVIQFPSIIPSVTTQNQKQNPSPQTKLEVTKASELKTSLPSFTFGLPSQLSSGEATTNQTAKVTVSQPTTTFSFFGGDTKLPSATPFSPSLPASTSVGKEAPTPSTTSVASNPSTNLTFVFGQPNAKPLTTGFNFGQAAASAGSTFNFGNSQPIFQFGQAQSSSTPTQKTIESVPSAPAFLNIDVPNVNPFNVSSSAGPQRRQFKKAFRRNK